MNFETSLLVRSPEDYAGSLLIALVPQSGLPASLAALDRAAGGVLGRVYASGDFKGKKDETAIVYGGGSAERVLLVGTGAADRTTRAVLRRAAGIGAKRARTIGLPAVALWC